MDRSGINMPHFLHWRDLWLVFLLMCIFATLAWIALTSNPDPARHSEPSSGLLDSTSSQAAALFLGEKFQGEFLPDDLAYRASWDTRLSRNPEVSLNAGTKLIEYRHLFPAI